MNVLVIYTHPDPNSFNHAVLEKLSQGLEDGNHNLTVIDLYKDKFDPVLVFNKDMRRSNPENDEVITRYQELIRKADHIIFIYPVWWYGTPAILKGFIDRVFVSGFAYTNKDGLPKGLLGDKSAWLVYTIDSPAWFVRLFRNNIEWKVMKNAILGYCGINHVKRIMLAGVKQSNEMKRQKWLNFVYSQASSRLT